MKTKTQTTLLVASLALLAAPAHADTAAFDNGMAKLLPAYEAIHKALSGDTEKGVTKAAKKIAKLAAKLDTKSVTGQHAAHYKTLPAKIAAAAKTLAKAKGLAAQREAFKALSRPFAMWATMSKPEGVNVVFCSMAKGSWLQRDKTIANPYYGSKMLRCGEVVAGAHKGHAGGHMKMKHGH